MMISIYVHVISDLIVYFLSQDVVLGLNSLFSVSINMSAQIKIIIIIIIIIIIVGSTQF